MRAEIERPRLWPDVVSSSGMPRIAITNFFQKRVANPLMRRLPIQTLLETTGRMSATHA